MFGKSLFLGSSEFDTLVGGGATLDGDFTADGKVRIDGKIKGNVKINGDLITGETALILGNVSAVNIELGGTIEGNVYCKDQLRLTSTANLIGDIQVKGLTIDEGGKFQGICSISALEKTTSKNINTIALESNEEVTRLKKKPIITRPQINDTKNI